MDLLTTYTYTRLGTKSNYSATANLHNSQITTAYAKLFQPALSLPAVPWQQLLTVEILQLHALKLSLHRLPYKIDLVVPIVIKVTPRHVPPRNIPFPTVPLLLRVDSLLRERVYLAVA
jgi:hypothetical protein